MSIPFRSFTRRRVLAGMAAASAFSALSASAHEDTGSEAIQSFRIDIPEESIVNLRRRLAVTRWPKSETVTDQSQGV